jgi:chemotaxis protein MotB
MRENGIHIAELLAHNFNPNDPFEIIVAGHTDNVPMDTPQFPSNWHLGNARATNFLELLMDESHIDPWYFHTRSGGEFRPIASNDTADGRQANRRVEVMISMAQENPLWDRPLGPPS